MFVFLVCLLEFVKQLKIRQLFSFIGLNQASKVELVKGQLISE